MALFFIEREGFPARLEWIQLNKVTIMFWFKPKVFFKFWFFLIISIVTTGCFSNNSKKNVTRVLTNQPRVSENNDYDRDRDSRSRTHCSQRDSYSEEISLRELKFVDSNNVGEYLLKGTCELNNDLVYVTVNGYKTSSNPKCDKGRWEVMLDLTSVANEEDTVTFEITHNRDSICHEVSVAFQGPENYVPIPPIDDYYESGFYVMKYEAKIGDRGPNAKAVSVTKGQPALRITYQEALNLCQNNGSRYSLIRNDQWQNIVYSIEETHENWSQGRSTPSDDNALNCGLFIGNPLEASSNDEDDCAASSCNSGWDENRRTHLLPNGERIWDICGNVGEIMKDKYRKSYIFDDHVYQMPSTLKKLFGPKKTYRLVSANRRSNAWNLGYAKINKGNDLIVRGLPSREAGIFSVDITADQATRRGYSGNIGFRCVYIP